MKKLYERLLQRNLYLKENNSVSFLPTVDIIGEKYKFSNGVKKIQSYYKLKSKPEFFTHNKEKYYNFTSGDPLSYKPFKPAINNMKQSLNNKSFFEYPQTSGTEEDKNIIVDYCKSINILKNEYGESLDYKNIAFTSSTTHAFSMIMELIANPGDAIIVSSPNYGLFDFIPERLGEKIVTLPLRKENDYYIDINELEKLIETTNKTLEKNNRVIAYLNINPHNPTGKVMGIKQKEMLYNIGKCCKKHNMFVIDDMVYRDLTYDLENVAMPIAIYDNFFDNTITLFGLSKSFSLAGIRGGVVVANQMIIKSIIDKIFHHMDSMPLLTISALTGTFNKNSSRANYYKKYVKSLINEYKQKYSIAVAIVNGIDKVENEYREQTRKLITSLIGTKQAQKALSGIELLDFPTNLIPESGFFALLDFTKIKNKRYKNLVIKNDIDLFKFLFKEANTKVIPGSAMMWPYKNELIIRLTFAIENDALVYSLLSIKQALEVLE